MARNDGRIEAGQKLAGAISARAWNRAQDAADRVLGVGTGATGGGAFSRGPDSAASIVYVKNTSGQKVDRWGVLGVDGIEIDPSQQPETGPNAASIAETNKKKVASFEGNPLVLTGVKPVRYTSYYYVAPTGTSGPTSIPPPDHSYAFVIAIEPIENNKIGRAAIAGCVPVKIHVRNEWHRCARIKNDSTQLVESCVHGPARIIWLEDQENPLTSVPGPAQPNTLYYETALLNSTGPLTQSPPRWAVVVF